MSAERIGALVALVTLLGGLIWSTIEIADDMGVMRANIASNTASLDVLVDAYVRMTACGGRDRDGDAN